MATMASTGAEPPVSLDSKCPGGREASKNRAACAISIPVERERSRTRFDEGCERLWLASQKPAEGRGSEVFSRDREGGER